MKHTIKLTIIFFFLGFLTPEAQEVKLKRANEKYEAIAYIDASEIYMDVAKSGYRSEELLKNLGNTQYFNANYEAASTWYGELFLLTENVKPVYFLRYSQSLKAMGDNENASIWFNKYALKINLKDKDFENTEDYLQIIDENSDRYTLNTLSINKDGIDFGTGFKDSDSNTYNNIVFASTNGTGKVTVRNLSDWDGLSYLDLYESPLNEDGSLGEPVKLKGEVNTKYHESSAIFTKDGKTMYFTRNNTSPRLKRTKKEIQFLKIYRAHLVAGEWVDIEDLTINGDNYSTAHPALSPSEDKLYFVSDREQTIGQTDIFMVTINSDGTLGMPVNLGEKINTKGRESFPFITDDNELYFSSDGHFGLGGYDVFYILLKGNGFSGNILNVGRPINSSFDDFAFVINNHKGYISSNRSEGQGYDDIYSFIENKDIKDFTFSSLFGTVTDQKTKHPLSNVAITIVDINNNEIAKTQTDANGYYRLKLSRFNSYIIKATKDEYDGDDVFSKKNIRERENNFELSRNVIEITNGEDIAKLLNVKIYFDFDGFNISQEARVELEKIIIVLKQNPTVKLDIRSHTDSQGNDAYNMILSQKRYESSLNYLVEKGGISASRLTGKGYGETQLINSCKNGSDCDDLEHQVNRRSEFIIINN